MKSLCPTLLVSSCLLACGLTLTPAIANRAIAQLSPEDCPEPLLDRLQRYRLQPGDTIEAIAAANGVLPGTLVRLNPALQGETVPAGTEILIPPFNGVRLEVPTGVTWSDLEAAYGVRADVLFELNGCVAVPEVIFVPGVSWEARSDKAEGYRGLSGGYPLPETAAIALNYGEGAAGFHSGVDLLAEVGTPVLAAEGGTVAFAGEQGQYGRLVVINHPDRLQTRYAHLDSIRVAAGEAIARGAVLGTVGGSGRPDTEASHLHFEVRYDTPQGWVAQDPSLHLESLLSGDRADREELFPPAETLPVLNP